MPKTMRIAESKQRLLDMLNQQGDVATAGLASTLLDVYLPFAQIAVEDDEGLGAEPEMLGRWLELVLPGIVRD